MKVIVTVPTWNEAENIGRLIDEIRALPQGVEVLVADDDSPDGTWRIVEAKAKADPGVHLLRRTTNRGRGTAGAAAYVRALELGADAIGEMDADFSHDPTFIPALLEPLDRVDVVVGSRLVPGGRDVGRPWIRRFITGVSSRFARCVLGLPVRDANSGFRFFTRRALEWADPARAISTGPSIVHELLFKAVRAGATVAEVPITFVERERGETKLNVGRLVDGWRKILAFRWWAWTGRL
jgi:dolichol-phosphate mannosyltransferase